MEIESQALKLYVTFQHEVMQVQVQVPSKQGGFNASTL